MRTETIEFLQETKLLKRKCQMPGVSSQEAIHRSQLGISWHSVGVVWVCDPSPRGGGGVKAGKTTFLSLFDLSKSSGTPPWEEIKSHHFPSIHPVAQEGKVLRTGKSKTSSERKKALRSYLSISSCGSSRENALYTSPHPPPSVRKSCLISERVENHEHGRGLSLTPSRTQTQRLLSPT